MKKLFQITSQLLKDQSGVSMILVSLSMFMLIGLTAIVVDAGRLYFEKSKLQKALDAAVLGGAQVLTTSEDEAKNVAIDIAGKNDFNVKRAEITTGSNFIEIHKTVNKQLTFARVLGFVQSDVAAYARAEIIGDALISAKGVIPVGIEKGDYKKGTLYSLNKTPGEGNSGNYGFLSIDGTGADVLGKGIKDGTSLTIEDSNLLKTFVETEPGMNWGKVEEGFKSRINMDSSNGKCSSYTTADISCNRVVILPVIDSFKKANGKSDVQVVGFASFWIDSVDNHEAKGRFINIITSGTFVPGDNYGIYHVKLVN